MFDVLNHTPFQVGVAPMFDQYGGDVAVCTVKATFRIPEKGKAPVLSDEQLPILHAETFFDTPENSGIQYPADFILGKKGTDIGLNGTVYSPGNTPVKKLTASLRVGSYTKTIVVYGDRFWTKSLVAPGYTMTRPKPFVQMPITCDRLYGGTDDDKEGNLRVYDVNPHGTGFFLTNKKVGGSRVANFELPDKRISSWRKQPLPATFGFANPSWPHRVEYAGTYDDQWKTDHWPLFPEDLDYRFFNCAQKELVTSRFLKGGEAVILLNLTPGGQCVFKVPAYTVTIIFHLQHKSLTRKADCCTLTIEPDENRFYMVWATSVSLGKQRSNLQYAEASITRVRSGKS